MKIAIIGPAYPFRGGIAAFNERMARAFIDEGHQVEIYTFTLQYPKILFPGKTQYSTDPKPEGLKITRMINSINPFNWISSGIRIRKTNPDVIVFAYWLPFFGLCFGNIINRLRKNEKIKFIGLIHNMIPHESRIGDKILSTYFIKRLDGSVSMSDIVFKDIDKFDKNKPKALLSHPLYDNFGDPKPKLEALNRLKLDPEYKYLLFFGLIRDYKGLDILIKAFSDIRFRSHKIKLIVAGEYYSNEKFYSDLISDYNLDNDIIQINKFIPDSEVADFFNACDLVVQPYKSATQSGVTQIAYHFNKAMIVTNVGALPQMCPDGEVGFVVSPNPKEISDAIFKYLFETDQEAMENRIIEYKKRYSWEEFTRRFFSFVSKVK